MRDENGHHRQSIDQLTTEIQKKLLDVDGDEETNKMQDSLKDLDVKSQLVATKVDERLGVLEEALGNVSRIIFFYSSAQLMKSCSLIQSQVMCPVICEYNDTDVYS